MLVAATAPLPQPAASRSRGGLAWQDPKATYGPVGGSSDRSRAAAPAAPEPTTFRRGRTSRPELGAMELLRRGEDDANFCGYISGNSKSYTCTNTDDTCFASDSVFGCCSSGVDLNSCASNMEIQCLASTDADSIVVLVSSLTHVCTAGTKTECVTWVLITGGGTGEVATQFKCGTDDVTSTLYPTTVESSQSSSSQASSSQASSSASSSRGLSWLDPTTRHSTSTTSATSLPTSLTNGTSSTTSHGVSGGVVGGITAGAVALVAFAAFLVYWIARKRRTVNMAMASQARADASINEDYGGPRAGAAAAGAGAGGFLSRVGLGHNAGVPVHKGGPVTSAMAVGAAGGAYLQDQKYQQYQMQQHLLAHDDTGAAGGNPISQPPTGAWGLPGGANYYPLQDQNRGSVYDGAGYGPRLGEAPLYDPQEAAAGAALPTSRPYSIQHRPAEM